MRLDWIGYALAGSGHKTITTLLSILAGNLRRTAVYLAPSVHLDHFSRCGAVSPLAPVDVGRVVALFGEVGHEGMMGR
jgi:hypothetical protein